MLLLDWPAEGLNEYLERELHTYIEHYHSYFKLYNDKYGIKKSSNFINFC